MPRRASATGIPQVTAAAPSANQVQMHRTTESHPALLVNPYSMGPSTQPSMQTFSSVGQAATPQQRVVQVLINKLKNRLPCHSGLSLDRVEAGHSMQQAIETLVDLAKDSLDMIAWALTELLDRLAKQTDLHTGHLSIEVLQSQLLILKVLAIIMASQWTKTSSASHVPETVPLSDPADDSPGSQATPIHPSESLWLEPPPLDDSCVKYILSVMIFFMRQTSFAEIPLMLQIRSTDVSFRDYEAEIVVRPPQDPSKPAEPRLRNQSSSSSVRSSKVYIKASVQIAINNINYEITHMSLLKSSLSVNNLIAKYVGRVIFHISASNWSVVYDRLSGKISHLASHPESTPDTVDLQLMAYSLLDRYRLVSVLNQLSSLLVNMRKEAQLAVAAYLRPAIWNWIDIFPHEFNEAIRTRGRMDGAPERVYELLVSNIHSGHERIYWPALAALLSCTTDKIRAELVNALTNSKARKDARFGETILKHLSSASKLTDVALTCVVDVCRAAAYVDPRLGDTTLPEIASDVADSIKGALYFTSTTRRHFWDSIEDIDVAMYAESLVAVSRFLPVEDAAPLFQVCMEPERSDAVKTCAIRASLTFVQDTARFSWHKSFDGLAVSVAPRCRDILRIIGVRRVDVDRQNNTKRVASRPKAKRIFAEPLSDRELLVLGILSMWRSDPDFFTIGLDGLVALRTWIKSAVRLWEAPFDISVKISTARCMQKVSEQTFMTPTTDPKYELLANIVKTALPVTVLSIVGNLLTTRSDIETQRLWISVAQQVLEVYAMDTQLPQIKQVQLDPQRLAAFMMSEVAFLVALSSADNDISIAAATGLRLISHAERQPDSPVNPYISDEDKSKRNPIYEQLGDPRATVAGRLGRQRRIRKLVRMLTFSAGIQLVVFHECFSRWRVLNDVIHPVGPNMKDGQEGGRGHVTAHEQDVRYQWQNLTLYLAALSGACHNEHIEYFSLDKVVPREMIPDKLRVVEKPRNNITRFLEALIEHLVDSDNTIRDIVREALGSELSPRLYPILIDHLNSQLRNLDGSDYDTTVTMLEQIISIVKLMSENAQVALQDVVNVDIGATMIALAQRVDRCMGESGHRLKMKYCGLCESLGSGTENIAFRNDSVARHEVLDYILRWMVLTKISMTDPGPTAFPDLNMACLRAAVKLLERLELQPVGQGDDEAANAVSRLFTKYSGALLGCMETCQHELSGADTSDTASIIHRVPMSPKAAELHDLVITGLTYLVSANSESGFKQCLPLAYDQDHRKRRIFAYVFARVIGQGTVFVVKDKSILKPRFQEVCDLVRGSDLMLAAIVCEVCPMNDVEIMISVLLNVFNTRASILALMKRLIEREVSLTANETGLFRSNSTLTRFLSAFGRLHGYNYLRSLVQPLIETMSTMPSGTSYEIDPAQAIGQDIGQNRRNVEYVAAKFINLMTSSLPVLPGLFREICAHIAKVVSEVWPESKYSAMGAFIFLRFISPAIVSPEIVDIEVPNNENNQVVRRGLMIVAKIIQNLANNIFFGKQAYMTCLNKFLESNIKTVTQFLSEMHKYAGRVDDTWTGTTSDETDVIVLHRFFHKHADRIGKELLSHSHTSGDGSGPNMGKQTWDNVCALLVDLGPPLEVPRLSILASSTHREYLEFMSKYSNRNTAPVDHLFMETDIKESTAVFVLRLSTIDVEGLDIELFMYHIFKTLTSMTYRSRTFDIILDCTSFTYHSEVPLQWLKYCAELIPLDIRTRFSAARILNPNTLMLKYMRRLYNISAGTPLCGEIKVYTSVLQLMEDVRTAALPPLGYPVSLEQENHENFNDVTMRTATRVPVNLRVGSSHIRVTSIKSIPISPGLSCQSTELIPLTDVSDIYNVSTGQDQHEFIIRRRQGITVYFSSPAREQIVKTIRSAKGLLKEAQAPLSERFSRFSNVPAALLHIGFLSVDLNDDELRSAAYELLAAVCDYLKYDKHPIVAPKAGFIPGDPIGFVAHLSENLAEFAPQLTLDFIHEVSAAMAGMDKSAFAHRISCLSYMSPWIQNLSHFSNPTHTLYERSGARLRDCIRTLADLSLSFPEIASTVQKEIWSEVAKLDASTVDIVLDELVRTATDGTVGTKRSEGISHIVSSLSSMNVRGRIYSRLRKALSKVPQKFTNSLLEHQNWNEISTLVRLTHAVGSQSNHFGQSFLYVPEVVHLVSLVAAEGPTLVRKSVYGTIINLLQSLYVARPDDNGVELKQLISECMLPETLKLFGLQRDTTTSEYTAIDIPNEKYALDIHERLVKLLVRLLGVVAENQGLLNVWRSRWMSLATATAFQQSPAVQTRSFVALSALAVRSVDDGFLYQILVAFRSALSRANESNTTVIVSMLRCLCKIVPAISETSTYVYSLFWLSVALLQVSHLGFYIEAAQLLEVTLENMENHGIFKTSSVETVLLGAREPLDEVMLQLDDMLRISFGQSFSFSLASIVFKGMRHSALKDSAESVLRTLLRVTSRARDHSDVRRPSPSLEALGYFIALLPVSTTQRTYQLLLNDCFVEDQSLVVVADSEEANESTPRINASILGIDDPQAALLAASFIGTILTTAQGDDAETEILYNLLSTLSVSFPQTITIIYDSLQDRIKDTFANSSNSRIIRSVSSIFKTSIQDPSRSRLASQPESNSSSTGTLNTMEDSSVGPSSSHLEALEIFGMQGLANSFQFLPPNRGHATKMINWIPGLVTLMINL